MRTPRRAGEMELPMGKGTYLGGHSKIFVSGSGTAWEVPDLPAQQPDHSRRDRWHEEMVGGERKVSKQGRSFLSMCAIAFHDDVLTDSNPKPPPVLQKQVRLSGGNRKWIVSDPDRLRLFEKFLNRTKSSQ
jgi:hypothetical protein